MSEEKRIPGVDEVRAELSQTQALIDGFQFHHCYTIEDYPIGRRERGKCELTYNFGRTKGWRTSRRTTNKFGRWCNPKCSTYGTHPIAIVTGEGVPHEAAWLRFGDSAVYLQAANGDCHTLYRAATSFKPRREQEVVRVQWRKVMLYSGQEATSETEAHVYPADPPALCDAWDEWAAFLARNVAAVKQRMMRLDTAA